jgi:hypothetical protein
LTRLARLSSIVPPVRARVILPAVPDYPFAA